MTYKSTSDQLNYIARVASHSTKPRPSGRIDDIPTWAREPEEYYNSVRNQYRSLADQLSKTQAELTEINAKLKTSLPFKEFEHFKQLHTALAARHGTLQEQASSYRLLARAAGEKSWTTVFFLCAKKLLKPEDFMILLAEVKEIVGREGFTEITRGETELSQQQRELQRHKKQKQRRRKEFREHYGKKPDDYVVRNNQVIVEKFAAKGWKAKLQNTEQNK